MKPFCGIPFLNRPDLLDRAIRSIPEDLEVYVINNGINHIPDCHPKIIDLLKKGQIIPKLSYSQSMNAFNMISDESKNPYWIHIHSDGIAGGGDVQRLIEAADKATEEGNKWLTIYTHYDVLCAFNTQAIKELGGWDQNFPDYFVDNDINYRAKLAGYEFLQIDHSVQHGECGEGSRTINSDENLKWFTQNVSFPNSERLYQLKWGGKPGHERFTTPYNR